MDSTVLLLRSNIYGHWLRPLPYKLTSYLLPEHLALVGAPWLPLELFCEREAKWLHADGDELTAWLFLELICEPKWLLA